MIDLSFFKNQVWLLDLQKHHEDVIIAVVDRAIAAESERDELKAKLAEMEKQEPDQYLSKLHGLPVYLRPSPAQRITEQDAREILKGSDQNPNTLSSVWLPDVLAKLNEHREPSDAVYKAWNRFQEKLNDDDPAKVTANKAEVPSEIERLAKFLEANDLRLIMFGDIWSFWHNKNSDGYDTLVDNVNKSPKLLRDFIHSLPPLKDGE